MTTKFTDAALISGTRRTEDGYLIAEARSVRTGIQLYRGSEVGKADMETVRVYRPPEEVFAQDSLQSFSHAPVTIDHPSEAVTGDNWKRLAAGEVSTAAKQDGEWIMLPLILKDAAAIKAVEDGKRELSAGYSCTLDWTPGTSPEGQEYDAIQRGIKINHLAVVDKARAGSRARIGDDANWGASPVTPKADERNPHMPDNLQTVVVDGLNVSTTDQGAQAIKKLTSDRDTAQKALFDAKADHAKALADKDAELAKKDAEIDGLKAKVLDASAMDSAVQARADLIDAAKKIAPKIETKGISDGDIRKAAVAAVRGADAVKDKSEAYIDAAFDLLAEDAKNQKPRNPLSDGIRDSQPTDTDPQSVRDAAYQAHMDRLNGVETKQKEA